MAGLTPLEAYDLIRFAETFEERLATANDAQERRRGLEREKRWLTEALALVKETRAGASELVEQARELPELAEVREEFAGDLLQVWVDCLERLHAGITFHAGSRAPLIETLFPHLKFPNLRKASRALVEQYAADLERRAALAYVARMLSQDTFVFAPQVLEQIRTAYAKWQSCFSSDALGEGDPEVREALLLRGKQVDLAIRQARLLAEAALSPIRGAWDESNIAAKPRKRAVKSPALAATPEGEEAPPTDETADASEATEDGVSPAGSASTEASDEAALTHGGPAAPSVSPEELASATDGSNARAAARSAGSSASDGTEASEGMAADSSAGTEAGQSAAPAPGKKSRTKKSKRAEAPPEAPSDS